MATLYLVATPIGNLKDISLRALATLKSVDFICAEDTRVTARLLSAYDIQKPLLTFHQHSGRGAYTRILSELREGHDLALVSDAGTPGINDPGQALVAEVVSAMPDVCVVPIPGANAGIAALSVSGFPSDKYLYAGFPPHKKGRRTYFADMVAWPRTVVFYESKHRIIRTLTELSVALGAAGQVREVLVGRELTKQFETLYRGTLEEIVPRLTGDNALGEFVVVLSPSRHE